MTSILSITSNNSWFTTPNNISLDKYVYNLMENTYNESKLKKKCFVVPHDGIIYSGIVSARIYNYLLNNIALSKSNTINIIMLCANHHINKKKLILPTVKMINFDNPSDNEYINKFIINDTIIQEIYENSSETDFDSGNDFINEHSFYNQLPFLTYIQTLIGFFGKKIKLIPIIVGTSNISSNLSTKLASIINEPSSFVIISSDFNHEGPRFNSSIPSSIKLKKMDLDAINFIGNHNDILLEKTSVCGHYALMLYAKVKNIKKENMEIIIRKTSFDSKYNKNNQFEDWYAQDSIVSYLGIIIK